MDQEKFCDLGEVDEAAGIDLTMAPTSGESYLRQVIAGRTKCQSIVVADRDFTRYSTRQTTQIPAEFLQNLPQSSSVPPETWRRRQTEQFDFLREKLSRERSKIAKSSKIKLPASGDEEGWKRFCFEICSPQLKDAVDERREEKDFLKCHRGTPPLLGVVASLDSIRAIDLFEFHVAWFAEEGYDSSRMHWLYALMLLIETPLTPEACSMLRDLAREFAKIRGSIPSDQDHPVVRAYYLFLCLIADYFGQRDLAEW